MFIIVLLLYCIWYSANHSHHITRGFYISVPADNTDETTCQIYVVIRGECDGAKVCRVVDNTAVCK